MTSILIKELSKSFGEKKVLNNICLEIGKGEIFGLLGPSGAGKTTMIKILTGRLKPDGGISEINGVNSEKLKQADYSRFGIMMEDFGLYERLSCLDNLKVFAEIYNIKKEEIKKTLEKVGLWEARKTAAVNLSKGMRSRLKLARVFMVNPDILFLDEPTSGLDPVTADEIQKMILGEKEKGKTIFLTTHTMTEAEKICDNIALLNEGSIVEYGSPAEICRRYNHTKRIKIHLKDGSDRNILHDAEAGEILAGMLKSGDVETIHTTEPNLETVFMEITGRELSK